MERIEQFDKLKQEIADMLIRYNQVSYKLSMGKSAFDNRKYKLEKMKNKLELAQHRHQVAKDKLEDAKISLYFKQLLYSEIKTHIKGLNMKLQQMKEEMKEFIPTNEEENKCKTEIIDTDICKISDDESLKEQYVNLDITDSESDQEDNDDDKSSV
jgi:hypothetical protein